MMSYAQSIIMFTYFDHVRTVCEMATHILTSPCPLVTRSLQVFMKGVPEEPRCGFSRAVVQILEMHGVDKFSSHNVLEDEVLRENVKEFSDWPTIPQVLLQIYLNYSQIYRSTVVMRSGSYTFLCM